MPCNFKLCPDFLLEAAEWRPSLGDNDGGAGDAESDLMLGDGGQSKPGGGEREVGEEGIGEDVGEEVEQGGGGCRDVGEVEVGGEVVYGAGGLCVDQNLEVEPAEPWSEQYFLC